MNDAKPVRLTFPSYDVGAASIVADGKRVGFCLGEFYCWRAYLFPVADPHTRRPGGEEEVTGKRLADLRETLRARCQRSWSVQLALRLGGGLRVTEQFARPVEPACLLDQVKDVNQHDCGLRGSASRQAHGPVLQAHRVDYFGEVCPRVAYLHRVGNQVHEYRVTDCPKSLLVQDVLMYHSLMSNATTQTAGKWISKRAARDLFRAAKLNEQQLYPAAERHYAEHGTWPGDYLQAKHETARAFERFIDAGIFSGITIGA